MEFKPSQALSISVLNQDNEQRFYWIEDNDQIQTIYEASDRDSDRHKLSKKIRSFEGKYSKNKVGAPSRWSFNPNSACGSIETTTIGNMHPTSKMNFVRIDFETNQYFKV